MAISEYVLTRPDIDSAVVVSGIVSIELFIPSIPNIDVVVSS